MGALEEVELREDIRFTLNDSEGQPHEYQVVQHGGKEGLKLGLRILKLLGPTIVNMLRDVRKLDELKDILEMEVDLSGVLNELLGILLDLPDLIDELLKHTQRDELTLSNKAVFDKAYQGNYGELLGAVIKVFQANGYTSFLPKGSITLPGK